MAKCDICNNKIGFGKFKYKFKSGQVIDGNCRIRLGLPDSVIKYKENFDRCRDKVQAQIAREEAAKNFEATTYFGDCLAVNDDEKTFVVYPIHTPLAKEYPTLFKFDDFLSFDIIEDGNTVKGGLGRAALGGIAFGGAGAVVGAVTGKTKKTLSEYKIKLNFEDPGNPFYILNLLPTEVKKGSPAYSKAENAMNETVAGLQYILRK